MRRPERGVDPAIEAVGIPAKFGTRHGLAAAGGCLANVGVHGSSVELKLEKPWDRNVTITTPLVDTVTTPMLLETVVSGRLTPRNLITHEFRLEDLMEAWHAFADAATKKAFKVIVRAR